MILHRLPTLRFKDRPAPALTSIIHHLAKMSQSAQPPYVAIAQRKQAQLDAGIPAEWKLPAHLVPAGMLSVADSLTKANQYQRVNVMDIPRTSGLLTRRELEITEDFDVRGLLSQMADGNLSAEDVARGFCKVGLLLLLWLGFHIY